MSRRKYEPASGLDPFVAIKLFLFAYGFWTRRFGKKFVLGGMAVSTLVVLLLIARDSL